MSNIIERIQAYDGFNLAKSKAGMEREELVNDAFKILESLYYDLLNIPEDHLTTLEKNTLKRLQNANQY